MLVGWRCIATAATIVSCCHAAEVPILVPGAEPSPAAGGVRPPGHEAAIAPPPAIGVLLPITGEYKSFGEPCLKGVRLALGAVGDRLPAVRTVVVDSRGTAGEAAAAYARLAADAGVVAVLGPMLAWELEAVRPAALAAGLTTLTFSQRSTSPDHVLLRFGMTKDDQTRVLAAYAVGERGFRRFGILRPDDRYGSELATSFRDEVERAGARVIADSAYDRAKADFQPDLQKFRAHVPVGENGAPALDAVFLPDSVDKVVLLAPYLAYVGLRGVALLGASGWNRPEALKSGLPSVDGAVFVDGFFLYSFLPEVRNFVDAYRDAYHADPGILDAYGYDAAALVRDAIAGGATTRAAVAAVLRRPARRVGATGVMRLDADGRIERDLFLLTFKEGTVRELERPGAAPDAAQTPVPRAMPIGNVPHPAYDSRGDELR